MVVTPVDCVRLRGWLLVVIVVVAVAVVAAAAVMFRARPCTDTASIADDNLSCTESFKY